MNPGHPESFWRLRKRKAIKAISAGGGYDAIAEAWGTSHAYAYVAVRDRWPHLQDEIRNRRTKVGLHPNVIYHRLLTVKESKTQSQAARKLGISGPALCLFLQRHAPDGVDAALADYQPDFWGEVAA